MGAIEWHRYPTISAQPSAQAFMESCTKRQLAAKTLDAYAQSLEDLFQTFVGFAGSAGMLPADLATRVIEADDEDIETYLDDLYKRPPDRRRRNVRYLSGTGLSPNTIQLRVVTARLYYDFLIRRRLRTDPVNPVPRGNIGRDGRNPARGPVRKRRADIWIPTDDQWERIVTDLVQRESLRNQVLILLTYDGALRRQEVVALRLDDIDLSAGLVTVRPETTKNGCKRIFPLSSSTESLLRDYVQTDRRQILAGFGGEAAGPLLVSESPRNPGDALRPGAVNDIVDRLRTRLALPRFHPHTLRHLRSHVLERCELPADDIRLFLGHQDVKTTNLYLKQMGSGRVSKRVRAATAPFDARMRQLIQGLRAAAHDTATDASIARQTD